MPDPNILGAATIGLTQGLSSAQAFLPKLSDVRKGASPELIGDVRMGEVATAIVTIGIGAIVSSLTGSPIPTFVSALIVLGIILLYEAALRGDRLFEPKVSDNA
jgi:hypothetical protein